MISEVCAEIRNYFVLSGDVLVGDYRIEDGSVVPSCPFLDGQYYRIVGSVFNDGVHKHGEETLTDEPQFHGAIWLMRVPKDFLQLADEIAQWQAKNGGVDSAAMSPYNSESFGGYSYTKGTRASASGGSSGSSVSWKDAFAQRLNVYRRIRTI